MSSELRDWIPTGWHYEESAAPAVACYTDDCESPHHVDEDRFEYEFFVWPAERGHWSKQTFDLFRQFTWRHVMEFTEKEWGLFRAGVERDGITFREIERRPVVPVRLVL